MTQKLKIKIKETVEEKRMLTDAEMALYDVYYMSESSSVELGIHQFWKTQGFDYKSYDGNEGTFTKETTRDANYNEIHAWHESQALIYYPSLRDQGILEHCNCYFGKKKCYEKILKDKEIILEIEESE